MSKIKGLLEIASDVAVVVLASVVLLSVLRQHFSAPRPMTVDARHFIHPRAGNQALLWYGRAEMSVLLLLNSRCPACLEGVNEYITLSRLLAERDADVQAFGIFQDESPDRVEKYRGLGFPFPIRQVTDFRRYSVSGTPTIVVVDRIGTIRDFWIGKVQAGSLINRLIGEM
jgi:hypothetical protein